MIKHIVMWKLPQKKDGLCKEEISLKIKNSLEELTNKISEIVSLQVGINFNSAPMAYDVCLVTDFKTKQDLDAYQNNPYHLEAAAYIRDVNEGRVVVDYEY